MKKMKNFIKNHAFGLLLVIFIVTLLSYNTFLYDFMKLFFILSSILYIVYNTKIKIKIKKCNCIKCNKDCLENDKESK